MLRALSHVAKLAPAATAASTVSTWPSAAPRSSAASAASCSARLTGRRRPKQPQRTACGDVNHARPTTRHGIVGRTRWCGGQQHRGHRLRRAADGGRVCGSGVGDGRSHCRCSRRAGGAPWGCARAREARARDSRWTASETRPFDSNAGLQQKPRRWCLAAQMSRVAPPHSLARSWDRRTGPQQPRGRRRAQRRGRRRRGAAIVAAPSRALCWRATPGTRRLCTYIGETSKFASATRR